MGREKRGPKSKKEKKATGYIIKIRDTRKEGENICVGAISNQFLSRKKRTGHLRGKKKKRGTGGHVRGERQRKGGLTRKGLKTFEGEERHRPGTKEGLKKITKRKVGLFTGGKGG